MLYLKIMILGGTNDFIMVLLIKMMIFPNIFYKYHQQCLLGYNYTTSLIYKSQTSPNKSYIIRNKYSQNQFDYRENVPVRSNGDQGLN